jgi:hypothetical protein
MALMVPLVNLCKAVCRMCEIDSEYQAGSAEDKAS